MRKPRAFVASAVEDLSGIVGAKFSTRTRMTMCGRLRLSLTLALVLAWAGPAWAQVAFGQFKASATAAAFATDGIEAITFDSTVASGSRVVVFFFVQSASRTVSSVVDDGSNTYALCGADGTIEDSGNALEAWAYCAKTTASMQTVTVTLSSAIASDAVVFAYAFTGDDSTANGSLQSATAQTSPSGTSHDSGNVTTSGTGAMLVGASISSGLNLDADTDFTSPTGADYNIGSLGAVSGYDSVNAGTFSWTGTSAGNRQPLNFVIALEPAAASGGCTGGLTLLGAGKCE